MTMTMVQFADENQISMQVNSLFLLVETLIFQNDFIPL